LAANSTTTTIKPEIHREDLTIPDFTTFEYVIIVTSLMFCCGTFAIFLIICYCNRLKAEALKRFHISQREKIKQQQIKKNSEESSVHESNMMNLMTNSSNTMVTDNEFDGDTPSKSPISGSFLRSKYEPKYNKVSTENTENENTSLSIVRIHKLSNSNQATKAMSPNPFNINNNIKYYDHGNVGSDSNMGSEQSSIVQHHHHIYYINAKDDNHHILPQLTNKMSHNEPMAPYTSYHSDNNHNIQFTANNVPIPYDTNCHQLQQNQINQYQINQIIQIQDPNQLRINSMASNMSIPPIPDNVPTFPLNLNSLQLPKAHRKETSITSLTSITSTNQISSSSSSDSSYSDSEHVALNDNHYKTTTTTKGNCVVDQDLNEKNDGNDTVQPGNTASS